jgi:hypothetical protein
MSTASERWPCFFREHVVSAGVGAAVVKGWPKAPFGILRGMWRRQHCQRLNPYGSDTCPYPKFKCGQEFLLAVRISANAKEPTRYFSKVARSAAARRADNKPLVREDASQVPYRTDEQERPGHTENRSEGPISGRRDHADQGDLAAEGPSLRSPDHRPQRIGELLGQIDPRPHQRRAKNGSESNKR